ncbi:MAG: fluoride efflux transporter CrcB [Cellvibrionales bacterium]|nr:fluoride efflux transporter CrcB [Cellvibrionales bacterium]
MSLYVNALMVFIGGAAGAGVRFTLGELLKTSPLPGWGAIFVANLIGSLLIGFITAVNLAPFPHNNDLSFVTLIQPLIAIGFCGGLTTYSTFSMDTVFLWLEQKYVQAIANTLGSISLCLIAVWFGMQLAS